MPLTPQQVDHIAELARLSLTPQEKKQFRDQLSSILDHVAQLQQLDTSSIKPTSSVLPPRSRLREDVPREGISHEQAISNAPQVKKGQYQVPPILEP